MEGRGISTAIIGFISLVLPSAEGQKGADMPLQVDGKVLLSGNFAELRNNHFHAGIDFKTGGREGLPVRVAKQGYISRISVNHVGYGKALYVSHPDGTTTVYAHLHSFAPHIAELVRQRQYKEECFRVDFDIKEGLLPVVCSEVIALSGNTGSSVGPHLHFEVRETASQEVLDPLDWYAPLIKDSRPPQAQGAYLYAVKGRGTVGNGHSPKTFCALGGTVEAWGYVGAAIRAYDFMDGTRNIYGVKYITLAVDGKEVFRSGITRFAFSETRLINSFIDYGEWKNNSLFLMKSFIEPGNALRFLYADRRGFICINQKRDYKFVYTLTDAFGNTSHFRFIVRGRQQLIPSAPACDEVFQYDTDNRFGAKGMRLLLPQGALYDNLYFRYAAPDDDRPSYRLHDEPVPLHRPSILSLFLSPADTLPPSAYGIVRLSENGYQWIGGTYSKGCIKASIDELGEYALAVDTVSPHIHLVALRAGHHPLIAFLLNDNLSGIASYRAELDGQFVLFERESETRIVCREHLPSGELTLSVTDGCSNVAVYTCSVG
ncbi:MAG: M23 family metallopeptidase [Tannerellaceae bacterium]|nr:M23 family metallopeptidase [Tannerellaceae bacterium]